MDTTPRIPLNKAMRLYWRHFIPLTLFPTVALLTVGQSKKPWAFWLVAPFFFGAGYYANLPYLRGKAPYSFCAMAGVFYLCGGILASLIWAELKVILGH
jgi:hypothetical protein